jgi:hypothetical protein
MTKVQREPRHNAIGCVVKKILSLSAPINEPGRNWRIKSCAGSLAVGLIIAGHYTVRSVLLVLCWSIC